MTSRKMRDGWPPETDRNRGARVNSPKCSLRERTPITQLPKTKGTQTVYREEVEDDRLTWTDFMETTRPVQLTTYTAPWTVTCNCGKVCKNQRCLPREIWLPSHDATNTLLSCFDKWNAGIKYTVLWGDSPISRLHMMSSRGGWSGPPSWATSALLQPRSSTTTQNKEQPTRKYAWQCQA